MPLFLTNKNFLVLAFFDFQKKKKNIAKESNFLKTLKDVYFLLSSRGNLTVLPVFKS